MEAVAAISVGDDAYINAAAVAAIYVAAIANSNVAVVAN